MFCLPRQEITFMFLIFSDNFPYTHKHTHTHGQKSNSCDLIWFDLFTETLSGSRPRQQFKQILVQIVCHKLKMTSTCWPKADETRSKCRAHPGGGEGQMSGSGSVPRVTSGDSCGCNYIYIYRADVTDWPINLNRATSVALCLFDAHNALCLAFGFGHQIDCPVATEDNAQLLICHCFPLSLSFSLSISPSNCVRCCLSVGHGAAVCWLRFLSLLATIELMTCNLLGY